MVTTIKYYIKIVLYKMNSYLFKKYMVNEVNEKLILFQSTHGTKYNDSPKAIFTNILYDNYFKDYTFVWAFKNCEKYSFDDPRVKTVEYGSNDYLSIASQAKYIITSTRLLNFIKLKRGQKYIQTWHGTPLKKLGVDISHTTNIRTSTKDYKLMNKLDSHKITYFISPNNYATSKFISAFELRKSQIFECGYPRNDFLVNHKISDVINLRKKLNIPFDKKVVLYAPTWRDNSYTLKEGYTDNSPINLEELSKQLDEHIILYRSHYMSKPKEQFENVIDVSDYDDINDLYIVSDILVTDYSSVFFDFAILRKPIIFYMYDLEEYQNKTRGFYFNIEQILPGPIVKTKSELIKHITQPTLSNNYDEFRTVFCANEDGSASKRVIDTLIKKI